MNRLALFALLALVSFVFGCSSTTEDSPAPSGARTSVVTADAGGMVVELLTNTRLETGLTPIFLKLSKGGEAVKDATVRFVPMMAMTSGKNHTCPTMGDPTLNAEGLYETAAVFQMPTGDSGTWSATVEIARPGADTVTASFASLTIHDSGRARTFTYTDPATSAATKYVASLNFVSAPKVGLNPVVVTFHRMQDMMTFPAVDDATIVLDPQMPSMGHGSPGSVNPTLVSGGRYEGQLSFSMIGEWETTVSFSQGAVQLGSAKFITTF